VEPTSFPESNDHFDKPSDLTYEQCEVLSVYKGLDSISGLPVIISCWKPTKAELEEINKTGRIWLFIYGTTMPPSCLGGLNPFKEESC
jgi:hypothetical protein